MNIRTRILATLAATMTLTAATAQTGGTNSSYSRFGVGLLSDQSQGFNRSMGGVAQGLRPKRRVNIQNPASYSAIDSLTFIFDVGMGLQRCIMKQGNAKQSLNNTSFDYVNMGFRLAPRLGMSLGFVPYSSIGYSFDQERKVTADSYTQQIVTQTMSYSGDGGLHEMYVGAGWEPLRGLSIGANIAYMWGNLQNYMVQSFAENGTTNSSYNSLHNYYTADIKTWKADIGLQYQARLSKEDCLNAGLTVGIGHKINSEATMLRYVSNGDSISRTADNAYELPMTYSAGLAWEHAGRLVVAADYAYEGWGKCVTPQVVEGDQGTAISYVASEGAYKNRHCVNAGMEYVASRYHRSYGKRIHYRLGAYYATPYQVINGQDGPKEFGFTAGLGLPIMNAHNVGSQLNIGLQWVHRSPSVSTMITENYFRINIGLTFSESWFMKWKFQ